MKPTALGCALLACAAAWSPGAAQTASSARTREIYVSVLDRAGAPATDLTVKDFTVREDGVAREVLKAERATAPMQIVLLIDDSQAAEPAIRDIREGVTALVDKLQGKAEIGLVTIGDRPTSIVEPTTSIDAIKKGISRIFSRTGAGAYLLEGIDEVSRGMRRREATRPVIVALTMEDVEFSSLSYTTVLERLYASGAALHVLAVGSGSASMSDEVRNRNIVISEGTERTGGRRDQILAINGIPGRFRALADELLNQYLVTYGAPDTLIPPTGVQVSVTRPGLTARARTRLAAK
jgi:VWFA-related protein